jgi:hypothetical protein
MLSLTGGGNGKGILGGAVAGGVRAPRCELPRDSPAVGDIRRTVFAGGSASWFERECSWGIRGNASSSLSLSCSFSRSNIVSLCRLVPLRPARPKRLSAWGRRESGESESAASTRNFIYEGTLFTVTRFLQGRGIEVPSCCALWSGAFQIFFPGQVHTGVVFSAGISSKGGPGRCDPDEDDERRTWPLTCEP